MSPTPPRSGPAIADTLVAEAAQELPEPIVLNHCTVVGQVVNFDRRFVQEFTLRLKPSHLSAKARRSLLPRDGDIGPAKARLLHALWRASEPDSGNRAGKGSWLSHEDLRSAGIVTARDLAPVLSDLRRRLCISEKHLELASDLIPDYVRTKSDSLRGLCAQFDRTAQPKLTTDQAQAGHPHVVGGKPIRFDSLLDLLFSLPPSPISREADGIRVLTPRLDLVFVFGSSTHALATNHAAFACDALWTHEIATVLQHRAPPDTKVYTHCRHDCDFLHEIKDPTSLMSRLQPHVVSMGMGDVNSVTAEIFRCHAHVDPDMEGDWVSPLQPRVYAPKSSVIIVSPTERLEPTDDRSFGWLCGVRSPFFDNRVSVICAGTNGTGTTAAAWALLQSLDLDAADHGWASLPVGNAVVIAREVAKSISRGDLVKIGGIRYMSVSGRPECVEWYEAHRSS